MSLRVGSIRVDLDGLDLTRGQVRSLIGYVAGIADALTPVAVEPEPSPPMGFAATIERAPDPPPDPYWESEE